MIQPPLVDVNLISVHDKKEYQYDATLSTYMVKSDDEYQVSVSLTRPPKDKTTVYSVDCTIDGENAGVSFLVKPECNHTFVFKGSPLDSTGVKRKNFKFGGANLVGSSFSSTTNVGVITVRVFEATDTGEEFRKQNNIQASNFTKKDVQESGRKFFEDQKLQTFLGSTFNGDAINYDLTYRASKLLCKVICKYDDESHVSMRKKARTSCL